MKAEIISNEKINKMMEEEERSRGNYIQWHGSKENDGLLYSLYYDSRTGKEYAVREIRGVHMGFNSNEPGKEEEFVKIVEREGACKASWGVTGRTMHSILAQQLAKKYPEYSFEIGYNYECTAYKKEE